MMFRLLVTSAVLATLGCTPAPKVSTVVIISLDTTRADHLGSYEGRANTPQLDGFAKQSVVFENVASACTTTLPSHVSWFTGALPIEHGTARNGFLVNDANEMLPEIFAAAGFRTVGVSAAVALSDLLNFPQGFDVWDQDDETLEGHVAANRSARRADAITDAAIAQLDQVQDKPLFLFVHYVDPHSPYDPPEPYRSMYGEVSPSADGSFQGIYQAQRGHRVGDPAVPLTRVSRKILRRAPGRPLGYDEDLARLYAGEVSFMDHHVGRLLDALRSRGRFDDALIVVSSDHGETFWEHPDAWSHGVSAYETAASVPLLIRFPAGKDGGTRVDDIVSTIDLFPTVLETAGLTAKRRGQASSLLPKISGEPRGPERPVFSQAPLAQGAIEENTKAWTNERKPLSVRRGKWKLIRTPYLDLEELFDLDADPNEQNNRLKEVTPEIEPVAAELRADLEALLAEARPLASTFFPRSKPAGKDDPQAALRAAMWERLKLLGYASED